MKETEIRYIVGIDEVGRGPLAGPITVCALIIGKKKATEILRKLRRHKLVDSKKLSAEKRLFFHRKLFKLKKEKAIDFVTSSVSEKYIDRHGISSATKKAIRNITQRLKIKPHLVFIKLDGILYAPNRFKYQKTIIKGDEKETIIAAASIVAKVKRDRIMERLGRLDKKYGFEIHKGYGTKLHCRAIKKHGLSPFHRKSFCRNILG